MEYREESGKDLMKTARERLRARVESGGAPVPRKPPEAPTGATEAFGAPALRIPCPSCRAAVGMPCFIPARPSLRPNGGTHPSRRESVRLGGAE